MELMNAVYKKDPLNLQLSLEYWCPSANHFDGTSHHHQRSRLNQRQVINNNKDSSIILTFHHISDFTLQIRTNVRRSASSSSLYFLHQDVDWFIKWEEKRACRFWNVTVEWFKFFQWFLTSINNFFKWFCWLIFSWRTRSGFMGFLLPIMSSLSQRTSTKTYFLKFFDDDEREINDVITYNSTDSSTRSRSSLSFHAIDRSHLETCNYLIKIKYIELNDVIRTISLATRFMRTHNGVLVK